MSDVTGAPAAASSAAPASLQDEIPFEDLRGIVDSMPEGVEFLASDGSVEEGADDLAPAPAPKQPVQKSPPQEEDADQQDADPGDDADAESDPDDEDQPLIERPRSWAKELDEEWASYPRAAQEKIAKREQERDSALRRSQNELADQRKATEAELSTVKQARQQYEERLPALMQALQDANAGTFADIKTVDDVAKLQSEDPFRFQQWQVHQMKMQTAKAELDASDKRKSDEMNSTWAKHVQDENVKFEESVPEGERAALTKMRDSAPKFLTERGFTQSDLNDLATGKSKLSIYDHRIQSLIKDSMRLAEIQAAPKVVADRKVPPVQKPGVPRGNTADAEIQALTRKLEQTGSEADGWALLQAQMRASTRRAS